MYLIDQMTNQSATRVEEKLGESTREKSVRKAEKRKKSVRLEEQSRKENSHVDSAQLLLHSGNGLSPFGFRLFRPFRPHF